MTTPEEGTVDERGRTFECGRWYPSEAVRTVVRPMAERWAEIRYAVENLTDEELKTLAAAIDAGDFAVDNCGWSEYEVVRVIASRVYDEPRRREMAKKAAASS